MITPGIAVIRSPLPMGRLLSECIGLAETRGSTTLGEGFAQDVAEAITSYCADHR